MYPIAIRDRYLIHDDTLQGWTGLGQTADTTVPTTIDTIATDTAAIIQAATNPNQPPTFKGQPIYPTAATGAGAGIGVLLAVGVGVFILAAAMKRR